MILQRPSCVITSAGTHLNYWCLLSSCTIMYMYRILLIILITHPDVVVGRHACAVRTNIEHGDEAAFVRLVQEPILSNRYRIYVYAWNFRSYCCVTSSCFCTFPTKSPDSQTGPTTSNSRLALSCAREGSASSMWW